MDVGNYACEFGLTGAVSIIHEADHTPADRIFAFFQSDVCIDIFVLQIPDIAILYRDIFSRTDNTGNIVLCLNSGEGVPYGVTLPLEGQSLQPKLGLCKSDSLVGFY